MPYAKLNRANIHLLNPEYYYYPEGTGSATGQGRTAIWVTWSGNTWTSYGLCKHLQPDFQKPPGIS